MNTDPVSSALDAIGLSGPARAELAAYLEPAFSRPGPLALPCEDEPSVAAWESYATGAGGGPIWPILQARIPQFRFAIAEGVSGSDAYLAATRRGDLDAAPPPGQGLRLSEPGSLRLTIHPTPAGRIPVLEPAGRDDFVALLRAVAHRSEPKPVPDSMGASMIAGFNNWDRIASLRAGWLAESDDPAGWAAHFRDAVLADKPLYQDRFIVLSDGPYSAVPAEDLGLTRDDWLARSRTIRLEHECTHYFTRRICGSMRNNVYDELMADYGGLVAAFGRFEADLFLRLMGIGRAGDLSPGARLLVYRGSPALSDAAFAALRTLVDRAARALETLHDTKLAAAADPESAFVARGETLLALSFLGIADLAAPDASERMEIALADARAICATNP